ncbi:hypothetical protein ACTXT7_014258, partial [Hymenolepis weldensis]
MAHQNFVLNDDIGFKAILFKRPFDKEAAYIPKVEKRSNYPEFRGPLCYSYASACPK